MEQATEVAPTLVRPNVMLSELYVLSGDAALAADRYRKILSIDPNNAIALNNLAYDLAIRERKPAEALPLARRAQALAPRDGTVLDTVGWIEYLLGHTAEAARLLVQAARAAPGNPEVRLHNAFALASQGARAAAQSELAEALKLNPAFEKRPDVQELKSKLQTEDK